MIKAILIDDEPANRKALQQQLARHCSDLEILAVCGNAAEGMAAIAQHKPQLVFLDIQMPHMSGFEMLNAIADKSFEVIFITAFNQYAVDAFKASAIDYLLKPVLAEELVAAVQKAAGKLNLINRAARIELLLEQWPQPKAQAKIALPNLHGFEIVPVADIVRCEAQQNYCLFILANTQRVLVSRNLGEYEPLLLPHGFLRVHKSHLVNLTHIKRYIRGEGGQLIMSDDESVDVSRTRKEELIRRLTSMH